MGKAEVKRRSRMHKNNRLGLCLIQCDADCELGEYHCWNYHRPNHKADWHDPVHCLAAAHQQRRKGRLLYLSSGSVHE